MRTCLSAISRRLVQVLCSKFTGLNKHQIMRYTLEIEIGLPRNRVIELFDNHENLKYWQAGFVSFEPMDGTAGQPGAKSRLRYLMGKREVELIETVTLRNLPDEFTGTYETRGMWNSVRNRFQVVDENTTRWRSEIEFRATDFMMKAVIAVMPGAFRKRSYLMMQNFKQWAETLAQREQA